MNNNNACIAIIIIIIIILIICMICYSFNVNKCDNFVGQQTQIYCNSRSNYYASCIINNPALCDEYTCNDGDAPSWYTCMDICISDRDKNCSFIKNLNITLCEMSCETICFDISGNTTHCNSSCLQVLIPSPSVQRTNYNKCVLSCVDSYACFGDCFEYIWG